MKLVVRKQDVLLLFASLIFVILLVWSAMPKEADSKLSRHFKDKVWYSQNDKQSCTCIAAKNLNLYLASEQGNTKKYDELKRNSSPYFTLNNQCALGVSDTTTEMRLAGKYEFYRQANIRELPLTGAVLEQLIRTKTPFVLIIDQADLNQHYASSYRIALAKNALDISTYFRLAMVYVNQAMFKARELIGQQAAGHAVTVLKYADESVIISDSYDQRPLYVASLDMLKSLANKNNFALVSH